MWVRLLGQVSPAGPQDDGELDCWIDGRKCGEFRNINWRSVDPLKVNKVQFSLWRELASHDRTGGGTTRICGSNC